MRLRRTRAKSKSGTGNVLQSLAELDPDLRSDSGLLCFAREPLPDFHELSGRQNLATSAARGRKVRQIASYEIIGLPSQSRSEKRLVIRIRQAQISVTRRVNGLAVL